jgi:hypothetical protein
MIEIPRHIWIESQSEGESQDACDVIVETDSGKIYTAMFVTLAYLRRQMDLSYTVSKQLPDTPPVRYAVLETPHIVIEQLDRDTIEDTIDNLLALDVFEGLFTRVTEDEDETATRTPNGGKRATAEVAAVVLSDVLVVER